MSQEQASTCPNCEAMAFLLFSGNASDGWHTHAELYRYRLAYNALLFNEWAACGKYEVHKSKRHSSGEPCFDGEYFIVVATLPSGQISNHYKLDFWEMFHCEEREFPATWDGHDPREALRRMEAHVASPVANCFSYAAEVERLQKALMDVTKDMKMTPIRFIVNTSLGSVCIPANPATIETVRKLREGKDA